LAGWNVLYCGDIIWAKTPLFMSISWHVAVLVSQLLANAGVGRLMHLSTREKMLDDMPAHYGGGEIQLDESRRLIINLGEWRTSSSGVNERVPEGTPYGILVQLQAWHFGFGGGEKYKDVTLLEGGWWVGNDMFLCGGRMVKGNITDAQYVKEASPADIWEKEAFLEKVKGLYAVVVERMRCYKITVSYYFTRPDEVHISMGKPSGGDTSFWVPIYRGYTAAHSSRRVDREWDTVYFLLDIALRELEGMQKQRAHTSD
jgi:hypothetical protein